MSNILTIFKTMKKNLLLTLLLATCVFLTSFAQPGAVDLSFNPADVGFGMDGGADSTMHAIAVQSDGKILIGGEFTSYNGTSRNGIARLNADGSLDTGFDPGAGVNYPYIYSIVLQSDGKILIGGYFTSYNGTTRNYIARLNSDGSLDTGFNPGTGADNQVSSIVIQSDGKILIGGQFTSYNGTARNYIARLNSDGSLDTGFDPGTGVSGGSYTSVSSIALQSDGKILIGGDFTSFNGTGRNLIARLNADGSLDTGFDPGTGVAGGSFTAVLSMALQSDGKILIGGFFTSYNGTSRNNIARINSDGSIDAGFNPTSVLYVNTMALQSDGKILIGGGSFYNLTICNFVRLNSDGSQDTGFNPGTENQSSVNSIALQSDGKILIGGTFTSYNGITENYLARLDSDGSVDISFNQGTGANNYVKSIAVQSDGKILIGGAFTFYNGSLKNRIARLNSDGSIDISFNPGTGANKYVNSIAVQSDGKILIGGNFISYNGTSRNYIARINTAGSIDASFNPGSGANSSVNAVAVQGDGKILIGGGFTVYDFTSRSRIARLNTNGSIDTGFNPGSGTNSGVNSIAIQSDGKILIAGGFTSYNGTARNYIARLNTSGSIDTGFNPGSGANSAVNFITLQSDGKILIAGGFTSYNGTARNGIARLNADGSLDTGFNPGSGANSAVNSIAIQSDGKILIAGSFTSYNGTARNGIARLNANGSIDTAFDPGTGADYPYIYSIVLQNDGKILTGGLFTSYNGTGRNRIARIMGDIITGFSKSVSLNATTLASPNPFNDYTIIKAGNGALLNNAIINLYDGNGSQVMNMTNLKPDEIRIDRGGLVPGMYFYQVVSNNALIGNGKLIVQE
jgi:uncharacterized delta-60 repeat protein